MDAKQAKKLTAEALSLDNEKVRIVLDCWHRAIEKAARAGLSRVGESDVDRVRTPIPASARRAALEQLVAEGFTVGTVGTGPNESETQVSW